ncbi:MAG: outer membrane beta-barrel protein [Flavobacteriales bacterium]
MKRYLAVIILILAFKAILAQQGTVKGVVVEKDNQQRVIGASIAVLDRDSQIVASTITDLNGSFLFSSINPGVYSIVVTFIGFERLSQTLRVRPGEEKNIELALSPSSLMLKTVNVVGTQIRMEQKGDTTQFNADAFKTNPDANAEDLISKMPGITNEGGAVKAGGEDVRRVLVDGKPFFGDDPNLALKALPAEIIDKIQVFEQMSDQAQFTGFDDGRGVKTINIVTKAGKNTGQFGRVTAGYGERGTYQASANLNYFKGKRRISILGLSNNINQQNFSTEDLVGALGSGAAQQMGGPGGRGRRNRGGGADINDFLINQQGGIVATNAIGINYSDEWSKKTKVTGSYFYNRADRYYEALTFRSFILPTDSGLTYLENGRADNLNNNHRINFRIEHEIDSLNSIIIIPRISAQTNDNREFFAGQNRIEDLLLLNSSETTNNAINRGITAENTLIYRYKFKKPKRTLSVSLTTEYNHRTGDGNLFADNRFYLNGVNNLIDQISDLNNRGWRVNSDFSYTEPLGEHFQLQFNYNPAYNYSENKKNTFNFDANTGLYSLPDSNLTNSFSSVYESHNLGAGLRYKKNKVSFMLRANGQVAWLSGSQTFPFEFDVRERFRNFLPRAMFNYRFSSAKNLRIFYRTSANAPSITQLQGVIDNRNPLFLSAGNPDLKQSVNHFMVLRYGGTNTENARNMFLFVTANAVQDYVANSTIIAGSDTLLQPGVLLRRGSQFTSPVNLSGFFNGRLFATFGIPVKWLRSNLNFTEGVNYNRLPALINGNLNLANNYAFSQGVVLSSNISENIDFNLGYTANYTIVRNSLQTQANNDFFTHQASARFNWIIRHRWIVNTQLTNTLLNGLYGDFNQQFTLMNVFLGYKFLKNKSLEARLSIYDLMNQNNNIARTVTETYIEDLQSNVLNRYLMFSIVWNVRNFGGVTQKTASDAGSEKRF